MTLGERLINHTDQHGIAISTMFKKIGISPVTVQDIIENNKYSPYIAKRIADALGDEFQQYVIPTRCQFCGKEFYGRLGAKFCCVKCSQQYLYYVRHDKPLPRFERPETKTKTYVDLENEARSQGISYGQRVAMERLAQGR